MDPLARWSNVTALKGGLLGVLAWWVISEIWWIVDPDAFGTNPGFRSESNAADLVVFYAFSVLVAFWLGWLIWRLRPGTRATQVLATATLLIYVGVAFAFALRPFTAVPLLFVFVPLVIGGFMRTLRRKLHRFANPS